MVNSLFMFELYDMESLKVSKILKCENLAIQTIMNIAIDL